MISLKQLCPLIDGQLKGDPEYTVVSINSLHKASANEITFAAKDNVDLHKVNAGALIVSRGSKLEFANLIYVDEPYMAFARLLNYFFPHRRFNEGIAPNAHIDSSAVIGSDVSIGPFSYVGENADIGDGTEIHSGVHIYPNAHIGKNCLIYANVVIREDVVIGDHTILHSGVVIGADGFGFTRLKDGTPVKIPQKGKVIIGNHCEIGANTCIDRSTIEETVLADYVKIDNLVQIGHNVKIGKNCAFSAQTGISGSTEIGETVITGGQVGIADHIKIADGSIIVAQSGIASNIQQKGIFAGSPHLDFIKWKKNSIIFKNLEIYIDRIKDLEKKIKELELNNKEKS